MPSVLFIVYLLTSLLIFLLYAYLLAYLLTYLFTYRDVHSLSARDLIQMQLNSISAVTGNTALSIPEKPRSQTVRLTNDQYQLNPTRVYPLRVYLRDVSAQVRSGVHVISFPCLYLICFNKMMYFSLIFNFVILIFLFGWKKCRSFK